MSQSSTRTPLGYSDENRRPEPPSSNAPQQQPAQSDPHANQLDQNFNAHLSHLVDSQMHLLNQQMMYVDAALYEVVDGVLDKIQLRCEQLLDRSTLDLCGEDITNNVSSSSGVGSIGAAVFAQYLDGRWYSGTITNVLNDETFVVTFDESDSYSVEVTKQKVILQSPIIISPGQTVAISEANVWDELMDTTEIQFGKVEKITIKRINQSDYGRLGYVVRCSGGNQKWFPHHMVSISTDQVSQVSNLTSVESDVQTQRKRTTTDCDMPNKKMKCTSVEDEKN